MPTGDIKQCEETTHHSEFSDTGACYCGFKKYPKPEIVKIPRCPFCKQEPEKVESDDGEMILESPGRATLFQFTKLEVFCATEGCPAFSNVVSLEKWSQRAPHEQEVMNIPDDEPIFVLRAKDSLTMIPVYTWIELAEKNRVGEVKLNNAVNRAKEMEKFQNKNKTKLPDQEMR